QSDEPEISGHRFGIAENLLVCFLTVCNSAAANVEKPACREILVGPAVRFTTYIASKSFGIEVMKLLAKSFLERENVFLAHLCQSVHAWLDYFVVVALAVPIEKIY